MGFNALQQVSLAISKKNKAISMSEAVANIFSGAFKANSVIPVVGAILATIAAGAAITSLFSSASQAEQKGDVGIKPNGGPIVASLQEGKIFQGTRNDGVEMSPTAGDPNMGRAGGGGANMAQINALLQQLINVITTSGTVTLDGQKVGEALKLGAFKIQ